MIRSHEKGTYKWRRNIIAALFVLFGIIAGLGFGGQKAMARGGTLYLVKWGVIKDGNETLLGASGEVKGSAIDGDLFLYFDHNVSQDTIAASNCAKVSLVTAEGDPVATKVWTINPLENDFYKRYIFITIDQEIDPNQTYRVEIQPGIIAKNGEDVYAGGFHLDDGSSSAPVTPEPVTEPEDDSIVQPIDPPEKKKAKKKVTAKADNSAAQNSNTSTRPNGNTAQQGRTGQQLSANTGSSADALPQTGTRMGYRLAPGVIVAGGEDLADLATVEPNPVSQDGLAYLLLIAGSIVMVVLGAAAEGISFRRRLGN